MTRKNRAERRRAARAENKHRAAARRRPGKGPLALGLAVLLLVLALVVAALVERDGEPAASSTPTPSALASGSASTSASAKPASKGSKTPTNSPVPKSSDDECTANAGGALHESFDSVSGWKVVQGPARIEADTTNKAEGEGALFLNNGIREEESFARKTFSSRKNFSDVSEFRIWLLQEGNLGLGVTGPWRMRLRTSEKDYFERVFPLPRVAKATRWCQDVSARADWTLNGKPNWSRIVSIEVGVPGYAGGARNRPGFDAFRTP